jgi:hypothetical protein
MTIASILNGRSARVQMLGKNDDRVDIERALRASFAEREAQTRDMLDESRGPTVGKRHREKECAAGHVIAAVMDHDPASHPIPVCNVHGMG